MCAVNLHATEASLLAHQSCVCESLGKIVQLVDFKRTRSPAGLQEASCILGGDSRGRDTDLADSDVALATSMA
jgi:hypothetical protein